MAANVSRYPQPTETDLKAINAIIARTTFGKKNTIAFAPGDYQAGAILSKRYTGWKPDATPCTACRLHLYDRLRSLAGYTYARHQLDESRIKARKAICKECPAFHAKTDSCGRLILDAISPKTVRIGEHDIKPCGCIITLKAQFKSESCPANRWP